jgi:hypothetical protein
MAGSDPNPPLPSILLIDDDAISREVLAMMLEMHGFLVGSAENGAQALELLESIDVPPGVILMDTQMPGLSGVDLAQAIRKACLAKAASGTRIVAISGSEVSEEVLLATDGFLLKPIQVESLLALLDEPGGSSDAPELALQAAAAAETQHSAELIDPIIDPSIDPIVLGKLKAMMPHSAVVEIYTAVASDLDTRLPALTAAVEAGDATEVARIAHIIKGGCGMVGLTGAQQAAAHLESSNLRETWPKELLQLHFAVNELQRILGDGLL